MRFWNRRKAASAERELNEQVQCAKDIALAASFVRSLETNDHAVNVELKRVAGSLERIAGRLDEGASATAA